MDYFYQPLQKNESIRILQITDTHLFSKRNEQLLGMNTTNSFQAVLDAILDNPFQFELVLATGDLVQDHNEQGYHCFAKMVEPLEKPIFWLPGNHDQAQMEKPLQQYSQINPQKQILIGDKWQILMLDSQVFGVPYGKLSSHQLDWLHTKLEQNKERYTLIALHHNILPTYSAWLDQHSLRNVHDFAQIIKPYHNIKAIIHGHIHQEMDQIWKGIRILSTPSTCIQFKPNSNNFTLDLIPQGWREIVLHPDGSINTEVKRLATNEFLPDFSAEGY
ncbi:MULTISPECIES: 3',5'-cyclic-AMP phosphodiesterase [Pasteurellaceae]|uniref:3',5'-cyclic adenosine monophosphate phosphodiesterase CpdA n=1 Tax=Pasteurella atlantica TaxID=2827233 RepID=A0AAW8CNM3_9PAST|nr:3',5'-cyclic-AMP phosphodiesterase [Pasteurella atlantica]MBR0573010.1 3',5'-cyclic-AMP phosphodiesterase [Pasteurella atlantica]MDP8038863.1 3',5'-cyclic-AMP phosphodiesterase [Pasteurella atlantica]MDP8041028.1 3',5'-cyclic-AMP phosphodiesterase [Pasteurella atlantica]MDP8043164.1 3',5'-cyclic-AMP phosphodiesterase [Pasteurella atlantica]MDP8045250.1 3',5'-cyclic-AMP phosphodiesterase [Pasteurella atlantica]